MKKLEENFIKTSRCDLSKSFLFLGLIAIVITNCDNRHNTYDNRYNTEVTTIYGRIMGILDANNTWAWKGVPYAKAPVGELRWKAPQDPDPWYGVMQTKDECEPCTQLITGVDLIRTGTAEGSEDCLYLNIWRPRSQEDNLPVYVWIHGGSNNIGKAANYNGSVIASRSNVVVVVIQYRLGPLGWFTHPALRHGDSLDDSGNFGTLDSIKALKWIRDNIEAFGGNPDNVTITGESAGAHNVMNLVISPMAANLFHRAVSQSGGMTTDSVGEGEVQAEDTVAALLAADRLTEVPGGDVEEYLRAKTSHEIFEAYFAASNDTLPTYDAYRDGYVIPGSVVATIRSGSYNKVPIILGANQYESKALMPLYGSALGLPWYDLILVLQGLIPSVDDVLPTQNDKDLYELTGYYGSRNWRAKFVDERARALRDQQDDVYAYQFNWGGPGSGPSPFDFIYGAGHSMGVAFFFGSDTSMWGYGFSPGNDTDGRVDLQNAMMAYLANFMRTGDPNGAGLTAWNEWSNVDGEPKVIIFDSDFDNALLFMSNEELTIPDVHTAYLIDISTRQISDPTFWSFLPAVGWGWVPEFFQWSTVE